MAKEQQFSTPFVVVFIPAFDEEETIGAVVKQVREELEKDVYEDFYSEVIVVDDGSTDGTADILSRINNQKLIITKLTHRVNLGKGAALKTGAEAAFSQGADAIIFMDSDGQHQAVDLPKFIKALESEKYDIVFGSRVSSHGIPLVRFLGNKFASVLVALLFKILVSDVICGFRAMTREAYDKIKWETSGYAAETEMVIKTGKRGLKYCEVPVETIYLDHVKGVTVLDAFEILFEVLRWKLTR